MMDREIALQIFNDGEEIDVRPYSDLLWIYPNKRYGRIFRPRCGELDGVVIDGADIPNSILVNYSDFVPIKKLMAQCNVQESVLVREDARNEDLRGKVVQVESYNAFGISGHILGCTDKVTLEMDDVYPPSKIFPARHLNYKRPRDEEWTVFSEIGKITLNDEGMFNCDRFLIKYGDLGVCLNNFELAIRHRLYKWSETSNSREYIIYYRGSWRTPLDIPFYTLPGHCLYHLEIARLANAAVMNDFRGRIFGTPRYIEPSFQKDV
jgi:hypothetical protein